MVWCSTDFDAARYLQILAAVRLNPSRVFTGAYCEPAGGRFLRR
jgi:hypothetical protein